LKNLITISKIGYYYGSVRL